MNSKMHNLKNKLKIFIGICLWNLVFVKSESIISTVDSLNINKLSNCKVELDDGKIIDLTSLDNQKSPRKARDGSYEYRFNPCSAIACKRGTQLSSAVCQAVLTSSSSNNCGDQNSADFSFNGQFLKITYTAAPRTSIVKCLCAQSESFRFINEEPENTYNLEFQSPCCCPDGCSGKKPSKKGLSFGSILLIIFFVLLFVYFVGGFIFMRFFRHANGKEAIPNYNFWISIPGDIKSGFSFTVSKIRGENRNNYSQL